MNLLPLITDNIVEILIRIIEFTQTREKILTRNISNMHNPEFVPKDLAVDEFCELLTTAINEHIANRRLVLRDTESIKFGTSGSLDVKPTVDKNAKELLENSPEKYIKLQINRLLENLLNQRIATELLRQKQEVTSINYGGF